jgi:hypothetical protein
MHWGNCKYITFRNIWIPGMESWKYIEFNMLKQRSFSVWYNDLKTVIFALEAAKFCFKLQMICWRLTKSAYRRLHSFTNKWYYEFKTNWKYHLHHILHVISNKWSSNIAHFTKWYYLLKYAILNSKRYMKYSSRYKSTLLSCIWILCVKCFMHDPITVGPIYMHHSQLKKIHFKLFQWFFVCFVMSEFVICWSVLEL